MTQLEPGARFGPYKIEGFVAGGGMGRVYAGAHDVYGHPVALKVLHERFADDPRWHRRFSEEGLLGMQLKHPNVLSARDLLEHEGQVALVMDLVRGGQTLLRLIEREWSSGLTLGDALTVFLRVVAGVEYLHDRGLVHGDLKPENVLIEGDLRQPDSWIPRVTDFGTVALVADPVMIDGRAAVVASPRYASPEHLRGIDHIEVRSDVYALGLLLHVLLSGEHASGARTVEAAATFVQGPVPMVRLVDQPEPLLAIVAKATAPAPADRYANCRDLALAVRDVLDDLGLGLQLEDLKADLATELLEQQAAAQKELQRAAARGEEDLSAAEDLDPGSVITFAGDPPEGSEDAGRGEADADEAGDVPESGDATEPDTTGPEAGDATEPDTTGPDAGDTTEPDTTGPEAGDATEPDTTGPEAGDAPEEDATPEPEPDAAPADEPTAPDGTPEAQHEGSSASRPAAPVVTTRADPKPGGLRLSLATETDDDEDTADGLPTVGEWSETAEDVPTMPAGARVAVSAVDAGNPFERDPDTAVDEKPPAPVVETSVDDPTDPTGASRAPTPTEPPPRHAVAPPPEEPRSSSTGLLIGGGVAAVVVLGAAAALVVWLSGALG